VPVSATMVDQKTIALEHTFTGVAAGSHTVKVRWLTTAATATAASTQRYLRCRAFYR
jgi:hypothetical protein